MERGTNGEDKDSKETEEITKVKKVYIEYGAGRAGLSSFVAHRLNELIGDDKKDDSLRDNIKFIIIDRDTRRNKLDKNFRDVFQTFREKMDIGDFNLEAYMEYLKNGKKGFD